MYPPRFSVSPVACHLTRAPPLSCCSPSPVASLPRGTRHQPHTVRPHVRELRHDFASMTGAFVRAIRYRARRTAVACTLSDATCSSRGIASGTRPPLRHAPDTTRAVSPFGNPGSSYQAHHGGACDQRSVPMLPETTPCRRNIALRQALRDQRCMGYNRG